MEARSQRKVRDGKEYDHLFPPAAGDDVTVEKNADVEATLRLIQRTVPQTLWHTTKIARVLKGDTLDETCENIWHFVYDHIKYKKDKDGVEQVRSPRRTWGERHTGVDCDCYTVFISSILSNLGIPHKARITKYPKRPPEVPRWQHIYPVVPKDGTINGDLDDRDSYIVMDCVKDDYDSEQPFLEYKDYDMKLDYLDGIDESGYGSDYETIEAQSIADLYDDDELGKISLKKIVKKVGSAIKTGVKQVGQAVKAAGDDIGKGIRFINRYVNPATVLLRNGFLLAMKNDMMNVASKLRYAYLTDEQAKKLGINPAALSKLRAVKDRAETIYWQAGGKKENLKKGILGGKGNKDKKVPLSGLAGLEEVYADLDEYNILHDNFEGTDGLGEVVSATAISAASGAVAAVAASLKQIKNLFSKDDSPEAQAFNSESENPITKLVSSVAPKATPLVSKITSVVNTAKSANSLVNQAKSFVPTAKPSAPSRSNATSSGNVLQKATDLVKQAAEMKARIVSTGKAFPSASTEPKASLVINQPANTRNAGTVAKALTTTVNKTSSSLFDEAKSMISKVSSNATPGSTVPAVTESTATPPIDAAGRSASTQDPLPMEDKWVDTPQTSTPPAKEGFMAQTTDWIKNNPGKSLLIAGAIATSGYLIAKSFKKPNRNEVSGLEGIPRRKKRFKRSKKKNRKKSHKKIKVQSIKL